MPGLLLTKNNEQLVEEENQYEAGKNRKQFESNLASYIRDVWERNKKAKLDVEQRMLKSLRQRKGMYDPLKLAMIKLTEGSEIFSKKTNIKCTALEAWLSEAYSPLRGKIWQLIHTPVPDLSPDILQKINKRVFDQIWLAAQTYQEETGDEITPEEFNVVAQEHQEHLKEQIVKIIKDEAKKAIDKMSEKIDDQLTEGGWAEAFADFIIDLATFGVGIIKGPIVRKRTEGAWAEENREWVFNMADRIVLEFDRVSPFDVYPEDDSVGIQDGNFIEYMRLSRDDFGDCIGLKGYNSEYIKQILEDTKSGSGTVAKLPIDTERAKIEGRYGDVDNSKRIGIINFWGSIPGNLLLEWGMDQSQIPDPILNYQVNCWLVDGTEYVVKSLKNITRVRPYSKTGFSKIPGSFWYESLPEVISDDQDMCNGTARAIQNNEAMASLPQTEVDISKMLDGANSDKVWAGRVWQTDTKGMNAGQAVRFTDCPSKVVELLQVFEKFSREMDEKSGIPAFAHGSPNIGGAGSTASGYAMFVSMSGKIVGKIVQDIDREVIATTIERVYNNNMMYDPNPDIKRDAKVVVRGVSSLVVKEQEEVRKAELIRDTNNPIDLQILGINGRTELLRDRIASISSLDVDKIIPDVPIQFFPTDGKGIVPHGKEVTRDVAGNPSGGTAVNTFNAVSQKGGM